MSRNRPLRIPVIDMVEIGADGGTRQGRRARQCHRRWDYEAALGAPRLLAAPAVAGDDPGAGGAAQLVVSGRGGPPRSGNGSTTVNVILFSDMKRLPPGTGQESTICCHCAFKTATVSPSPPSSGVKPNAAFSDSCEQRSVASCYIRNSRPVCLSL
jgi:hypothetical protein